MCMWMLVASALSCALCDADGVTVVVMISRGLFVLPSVSCLVLSVLHLFVSRLILSYLILSYLIPSATSARFFPTAMPLPCCSVPVPDPQALLGPRA